MRISRIVFGCWASGGGSEWGRKLDDSIYIDTIRHALEGGINIFDTAAGYGKGHSEELLKVALESAKSKVHIMTKNNAASLRKGKGKESIEQSLKRMGVDHADVYFLHWPNPDIPIEENVEELFKLREEGYIRYIGLSNVTVGHLERALKAGPVDVVQPCYSLFWRQAEKELLGYCRERSIGIVTYSTLAQGLLTGKFTKEWMFDEGDQRPQAIPLFKGDVFEAALDAVREISGISAGYGKTISQTAINWVLRQGGVNAAIVGAKMPGQIDENLGAVGWSLSDEDSERIGEIGMQTARRVHDWDSLFARKDARLELK